MLCSDANTQRNTHHNTKQQEDKKEVLLQEATAFLCFCLPEGCWGGPVVIAMQRVHVNLWKLPIRSHLLVMVDVSDHVATSTAALINWWYVKSSARGI